MRLAIDTSLNINLYRLVPLAIMLWPAGNAIADYALSPLFSQVAVTTEQIYLTEGDEVAGYEVTSDYDLERVHPVKGTVEPHYGVDVATPVGTKLIAPTAVEVHCWYDVNGGGEVANVTPAPAKSARSDGMKMLHLSTCVEGRYSAGESFALTGSSGLGTGAHLDARRMDKAEPTKQDIEPYLTGKLPPAKPAGRGLNVGRTANSELSDLDLVCSIGAAEGTRDSECRPTPAYSGHTDPGNGAHNQGSFSYQHGATSPEEADNRQLARLRLAEKGLQAKAQAKFGKPLSRPAISAALDLWNQSPAAGEDFVNHLPSATPSSSQIIEARDLSYVDPATGRLDAPGLGNDPGKVRADQARRTGEVLHQLERNQQPTLQERRLKHLDK